MHSVWNCVDSGRLKEQINKSNYKSVLRDTFTSYTERVWECPTWHLHFLHRESLGVSYVTPSLPTQRESGSVLRDTFASYTERVWECPTWHLRFLHRESLGVSYVTPSLPTQRESGSVLRDTFTSYTERVWECPTWHLHFLHREGEYYEEAVDNSILTLDHQNYSTDPTLVVSKWSVKYSNIEWPLLQS